MLLISGLSNSFAIRSYQLETDNCLWNFCMSALTVAPLHTLLAGTTSVQRPAQRVPLSHTNDTSTWHNTAVGGVQLPLHLPAIHAYMQIDISPRNEGGVLKGKDLHARR